MVFMIEKFLIFGVNLNRKGVPKPFSRKSKENGKTQRPYQRCLFNQSRFQI